MGAVVVLTAGGVTAWAADDAVKTRQADMKEMGKSLKAIKGIIDAGGNAADVVAPANKIVEVAGLIPSLFPKGSDQGKTAALPAIWENWDAFTKHADSLKTEATMLASAAQSGDLATVRAQFDKTAKECGACHKEFKKKED
ncbi:c-type cytochrome [Dongia sedimenti]|uniref:Cytochrome c n=1 Tax=Dongia sedimenti TaxID=3064282 RepID=A0ABU0YG77_9PROT|nr:cytochrome c [Rhodospirillaceae bacterium R-7]